MKGLVREHGRGYQYMFSVTRGGKRKYFTKSGFTRKSDAWSAMRDAMEPWKNKAHVDPSKDTLGVFLVNEWLPNQSGKKPTTRNGYTYWVEKRIVPELGHIPVCELTAGDIAALYTRLKVSGRMDGKPGGLSERSIKQCHAVLHGALEYAVKTRYITRSPMDDLADDVKPKPRRVKMNTWSGDALRAFLTSVEGDYPFGALFTLAAATGMRRSEVLGLRWSDINGEIISVQRGITTAGYDKYEGETKTGRTRVVEIDAATVAVLKRHRARQLQDRMKNAEFWQPTDLVFCDGMGVGLHPHSVSQTFDRRVARAKVPRIRFHDLRHTHATLLLLAGVHPKVVQERLGHWSIAITLDVYSHVTPSMQKGAATSIGAVMYGGGH